MKRILIMDDEIEVGNFFRHLLEEKGFNIKTAVNKNEFTTLISELSFDLALIDMKLPDSNGIQLLKQLKKSQPMCKAIIMTGYSTVKTAVEALKNGANDYIEKPFDDLELLEKTLDNFLSTEYISNQTETNQLATTIGFIIGENAAMNELAKLAEKIAKKNINILIEGETGTGKDVLANFIHHISQRYNQPFIRINCGAIPETLLESELFGHEKGAFTGAVKLKKGIFEIADNGTLFLDEIGEASLGIQVQLLRVLETGEYYRVGGEAVRKTNTRIIAATNKNLVQAVEEKTFREDLLYRLDVVKLNIPPLRKRIEDLNLYLNYFLQKVNASHLTFSGESLEIMKNYMWPGNVRELFNIVKRAAALVDEGETIVTPKYLPEKLLQNNHQNEDNYQMNDEFESFITSWTKNILSLWDGHNDIELDDVLFSVKELEKQVGRSFVLKSLKNHVGDRKKTADSLNITTRQLKYLLNEKGKI
ncbi:sigma-54 dependent transcriptional regulator [Lysinibacillus sp. BW-2-10]|uniref:sigma-54-dependent transcriptional regulator n=1 Tax=Lysinibacillus sp. BW-2-10 TaxID=2590030 RepID=UPI00117F99E8|nr:sigma-54 dependent transcriptional regulator [Lysinibacillus sp. BW-2-10]TSI10118.1 sigma-54-dependent Fis family transcriptional regulator [Lysinibacillus sp. BW-2-10]